MTPGSRILIVGALPSDTRWQCKVGDSGKAFLSDPDQETPEASSSELTGRLPEESLSLKFWQYLADLYSLTFVSNYRFNNYRSLGFEFIGEPSELSKDQSHEKKVVNMYMYFSEFSKPQYPITVWNADFNSEIFGKLADYTEENEKFDLIINDHCVSYFISQDGINNLLKFLKPDGICILGPAVAEKKVSFKMLAEKLDELRTDSFFRGCRVVDYQANKVGFRNKEITFINMNMFTSPEELDKQYNSYLEVINNPKCKDMLLGEKIKMLDEKIKPQLNKFINIISFDNFRAYVAMKGCRVTECKFGQIKDLIDCILPLLSYDFHLSQCLNMFSVGKRPEELDWVIIKPENRGH